MRILIVAELDPNTTEHEAKESLEEARMAMEAVGDVTTVTATLDMKEEKDIEDEELEADDDDGSIEEETE